MTQASNTAGRHCESCGAELSVPRGDHSDDETLFCSDCLVDTDCRQCGRTLTLSKDRFAELDGRPVCASCPSRGTASSSSSSWLLVGVGVVAALLAANWYYRPEITLHLGPSIQGLEAVAGPGLVIVVWALWRSIR